MKKFSYLLLSLLAAMSVLFTSCGDTEEAKVPMITLASTSTLDGAKVAPSAALKFIFTASKGENDLKTVVITAKNASGDAQAVEIGSISGFDSKSAISETLKNTIELDNNDKNNGITNGTINITAPAAVGTYTYTITVTDSKSVTAVQTIAVTVEVDTTSMYEVKEISSSAVLGAQKASAGSYYSVVDAAVIKSADFTANSSKINFSYAQTGATTDKVTDKLISISEREGEKLETNLTGGVDTYFAVSALDYSTATVAQINAITKSSLKKIDIAAGSTYEFVTANGEKGLIKVSSITGDKAKFEGTATIAVKVVAMKATAAEAK